MHLFLNALAVIGIVILCILGLLLLLLLAVLFIPVRYRICFSYPENRAGGNKEEVTGRLTWLFHLFYFPFSYRDGKTFYELRIMGINLLKWLPRQKKRKPSKPAAKQSSGKQNIKHGEKQAETRQETKPEIQKETQPFVLETEEVEKTKKRKRKKTEKFRDILQFFRELWERWLAFLERERDFWERVKKYIAFLKDDSVWDMVCILKDNVVHLWRKLKPKVVKGYIHFGTGDPGTTGEILGLMSFLYLAGQGKLRIQPEFEKACFDAGIEIRGRITVFTAVWIIYKVICSEQWGRFQKAYQKVRR